MERSWSGRSSVAFVQTKLNQIVTLALLMVLSKSLLNDYKGKIRSHYSLKASSTAYWPWYLLIKTAKTIIVEYPVSSNLCDNHTRGALCKYGFEKAFWVAGWQKVRPISLPNLRHDLDLCLYLHLPDWSLFGYYRFLKMYRIMQAPISCLHWVSKLLASSI